MDTDHYSWQRIFFSYMEDLLLHQNHIKIYTYVQTSYPKSQSKSNPYLWH